MILHIKQCPKCSRDKAKCEWRKEIATRISHLEPRKFRMTGHCPLYPKLLKMGTLVMVEIKSLDYSESYDSDGSPNQNGSWESLGLHQGRVVGYRRDFYRILLTEPVEAVRKDRHNKDWQSAHEQLVVATCVPAKRLQVVTDEDADRWWATVQERIKAATSEHYCDDDLGGSYEETNWNMLPRGFPEWDDTCLEPDEAEKYRKARGSTKRLGDLPPLPELPKSEQPPKPPTECELVASGADPGDIPF